MYKISVADLTDVVSDSAVAEDVQSILDCVVVALRKLKRLLITQLKKHKDRKGKLFFTFKLVAKSNLIKHICKVA